MLSSLSNFYHSIPASFWSLLWSAVALSGLLEVVKRLAVEDVAKLSEKTQTAAMSAVAFVAAGVQYMTQAAQTNPQLLGLHTGLLIAAMHLAYMFVIKPFTNLLTDARSFRQQTTPVADPPADAPAAG